MNKAICCIVEHHDVLAWKTDDDSVGVEDVSYDLQPVRRNCVTYTIHIEETQERTHQCDKRTETVSQTNDAL